MVKRLYLVAVTLWLGVVPLWGCRFVAPTVPADGTGSVLETSTSEAKVQVTVSIPPQKYFVERIGGDRVTVNAMVEPGANPHTYEPKPQQLKMLATSQAYFRIGVEFESAWMNRIKAANRSLQVVDTAEGVELLPMVAHHHHEDEAGENHHGEKEAMDGEPSTSDPHIWLSPPLVKQQAETVYGALVKLDPNGESVYRANLDKFLGDIDALDRDIRSTLAAVKTRKFMVFHPSWAYFAKAYNLEMIPIEVGGTEPSAAELAQLIERAKQEGIKVIFAQPEFSTKSAETIAQAIGGEVILLDTLTPNWLENMRQVTDKLARVMSAVFLVVIG
ncbi:MAG TPA: zinc ABC transporter substrate-binding protein [Oscillatoriaceae cyanobacterium M33_DOE_052]|uniref:Cation ABC transporter substrate-binding protein n=1 Tax=Planktothricoides sp. SpSt-374 TaxID=2282167 RepID=A0A7C3ZPF8_9CYAN|nr:zinc ABC transporter substrate-binding protein [Oscillatoriaceae cyanobacterium M33_DOE_052]